MPYVLERFKNLNQMPQQQKSLVKVAEVRGYKDNTLLNLACVVAVSTHAITEYLFEGSQLLHSCTNLSSGKSIVFGKVVIPIVSPINETLSFMTYDPIAQLEGKLTGVKAPAYYAPESGLVTKKGTLVYAPPSCWESIIQSDDIWVTDGIWDCVAMNAAGFPTIALMMSELTAATHRILGTYKRIYLVMDNDSAGGKLYKAMISAFPFVYRVVVPVSAAKDVDEYAVKRGLSALKIIAAGRSTYLK